MHFEIQISEKISSESQIILINDKNQIATLLENKIAQEKIADLFTASNAIAHIFDGASLKIFVLLIDTLESNRLAASSAYKLLTQYQIKHISIVSHCEKELNESFIEGLMLSTYNFEKYKSKKKDFVLHISLAHDVLSKSQLDTLYNIVLSNSIAKDFVNEPQSYLNATQYANDIKILADKYGFTATIFDKKKIESLKMGGILAVNKGSIQEPAFVITEYKHPNAKNKKPIVLVGKGVVYDTGGLSLKPTPNSMDLMKCDMGGSAVVIGTMVGLSLLEMPLHVIGLTPLTDNRPGLDAVAPGDVITMYSGDTVEVLNTDAEGRLILADALHYAKQYEPELVFDFATLTGAAAAAIGPEGTVCMGKDIEESLKEKLIASANKVHERLVEFPLWNEYAEQIKSDVADYKNLGGPYGGAITAGKFLEVFTAYPWMHFDIAGPAFIKSPTGYRQSGATGVGVRLMLDFLMKY